MLHEHSRKDKDNFVKIEWANIHQGLDRQFKTFPRSKTLDMPYDGTSIMHYLTTQGADPPGAAAIVSKVNIIIYIYKGIKKYPPPHAK